MERVNLDKGGQGWLIDPKELRIGNILEYENDLVHVTSLSLDIDDEYQEIIGFCKLGKDTDETADWNRALCARLNPVSVTHKILEKCGFSENGGEWSYPGNEFELIPYQDGYNMGINQGEYSHGRLIKYLHELQNLYFAIIGEELEVKL